MSFRDIIIIRHHYPEIIPGNKVLSSESNKTNSIKIGLQLYNLWQIHGHQLNLRNANSKPLSPIWASSSVTRKRQATGFEPLRHILLTLRIKIMAPQKFS